MPTYSEGPFRNWDAIHFPGGFYVSTILDLPFQRMVLVVPYPPGREETNPDAFLGVVRGVDSGASFDTTLIPVESAGPGINPGVYPSCLRTISRLYDVNGSPVSATPVLGYNVSHTGTTGIAGVYSYASESPNVPAMSCSLNLDAPAIPGFILDELVTITPPS